MNHGLRLRDNRPIRELCSVDRAGDTQVSIVVPTFRERENLGRLVTELFESLCDASLSAELIIVDDNSNDGTLELLEDLADVYPIRLITRTDVRGLATAVIRGLQMAQGEFVVVMDADLSHPPSMVSALLTPLESQTADFVIGSRYVSGATVDNSWSIFRRLNSRIAGLLAIGLSRAKDPMAGFFAMRRDTLGDLSQLNPCGYKIGLEVMVRCGCSRVTEIPIHFEDRRHGQSKLSLREQMLYIQHLIRLYAFRYPESSRFALFAAVGTSGMLLDVAAFVGLLPIIGLNASRAVAIWMAMTWNFELNRRVTFKEPRNTHPFHEYLRFCAACMLGAAVSWSISLSLIDGPEAVALRPFAAAIVGAGTAAVVNFITCRLWVFGRRKASVNSTALLPVPDNVNDSRVNRSRVAA